MNRCENWLKILQSNNYRLTAPRRLVVDIIDSSETILTPSQIFLIARQKDFSIGLVTIYRTLEKLEELGLIIRVHAEIGCQAFIGTPPGHQHLMICQSCHRAIFFSVEHVEGFIEEIGRRNNYQITDHFLQINGICAKCAERDYETR